MDAVRVGARGVGKDRLQRVPVRAGKLGAAAGQQHAVDAREHLLQRRRVPAVVVQRHRARARALDKLHVARGDVRLRRVVPLRQDAHRRAVVRRAQHQRAGQRHRGQHATQSRAHRRSIEKVWRSRSLGSNARMHAQRTGKKGVFQRVQRLSERKKGTSIKGGGSKERVREIDGKKEHCDATHDSRPRAHRRPARNTAASSCSRTRAEAEQPSALRPGMAQAEKERGPRQCVCAPLWTCHADARTHSNGLEAVELRAVPVAALRVVADGVARAQTDPVGERAVGLAQVAHEALHTESLVGAHCQKVTSKTNTKTQNRKDKKKKMKKKKKQQRLVVFSLFLFIIKNKKP